MFLGFLVWVCVWRVLTDLCVFGGIPFFQVMLPTGKNKDLTFMLWFSPYFEFFLVIEKSWGSDWWDFCYSILYNRGVYPEESFARVKKYGLPLLLTQDEGVKSFISNLTSQLSGNSHFLSHQVFCIAIYNGSERESERVEGTHEVAANQIISFFEEGLRVRSFISNLTSQLWGPSNLKLAIYIHRERERLLRELMK